MFYYFSSQIKCALKVNGIFYGIIDEQVKEINITKENAYIELSPVNINAKSICFLLDQTFFNSPPPLIYLTDLKGGYLIKFCPLIENNAFYIIAQEKFENALVTLFNENGVKLSLETQKDFFAQSFMLNANCAQIGQFWLNNSPFVYINLETSAQKNQLIIYSIEDKIKQVFCRNIDSFNLENQLCTSENFYDIAKHKVTSFWDYQDNKLIRIDYKIEKSDKFNIENLSPKIIPYAFLEDLLVGDKIEDYLSQTLMENAKFLSDFFGNFLGIIPPPKFRDYNEIGLIYAKEENLYYTQYFIIETENKKIVNIKKAD